MGRVWYNKIKMKSNFWKVLAVALAAATIVCVGAGCANNDSKGKESSTSSSASSDASKDESKDESGEASKSEESKSESADEDKEKDDEDSKADSDEDDDEDSDEENDEDSEEKDDEDEDSDEDTDEDTDEDSDEGDTDNETDEKFVGSWECNVGGEYIGITTKSDGSAEYVDVHGNTAPARWTVEDGYICIRAAGGLQKLSYSDGSLVDVDNYHEYMSVQTLSVFNSTDSDDEDESENESDEDTDIYIGAWEYNVGSKYSGLIIEADGSAIYKDESGNSVPGRWTVENGVLCVRAAGGLQQLVYVNGNLESVDTDAVYSPSSTLTAD